MTVEYIKNLLAQCHIINGYNIGVDYLASQENSLSIIPSGEEKIIKEYCDGEKLLSYGFSIVVRLCWAMGSNDKNREITQGISRWLKGLSENDFYRYNNICPQKIAVLKDFVVVADDIKSIRYEMKCSIEYLKK